MYIPTPSPINADPALRSYLERELHSIARALPPDYPVGYTENYGGGGTSAENAAAAEAALAANTVVSLGAGTYDNFTIDESNRTVIFRPGVTIKLPDDTLDAADTSGPAVLGITGDDVTLIGDFTVDGNRANNDSSGFAGDARQGSLRISGDRCRIEGEIFVTGAYYQGLSVNADTVSPAEISGLYIKKLRVFDPAHYAALIWSVEDWQIDEIEVDIGTNSAAGARVRVGTQASSTSKAQRGKIVSVRTNGAFICEPNCDYLHVDSVQCAAGKLQEPKHVQIGMWSADGSLVPSDAEGGPSFGMVQAEDCHVGTVVVDGHYQTGTNPVAFTNGNVGCSVGAIRVSGTTSEVSDCIIVENVNLTIGMLQLEGTASGGDGLEFEYDADTNNVHIGVVHSTGHSNAGKFDVLLDSNLGTNTPLIIGSINPDATKSIGVGHALYSRFPVALEDGITAPGTISGFAQIYIDAADGDLKVKFGDGTVKTLATDT